MAEKDLSWIPDFFTDRGIKVDVTKEAWKIFTKNLAPKSSSIPGKFVPGLQPFMWKMQGAIDTDWWTSYDRDEEGFTKQNKSDLYYIMDTKKWSNHRCCMPCPGFGAPFNVDDQLTGTFGDIPIIEDPYAIWAWKMSNKTLFTKIEFLYYEILDTTVMEMQEYADNVSQEREEFFMDLFEKNQEKYGLQPPSNFSSFLKWCKHLKQQMGGDYKIVETWLKKQKARWTKDFMWLEIVDRPIREIAQTKSWEEDAEELRNAVRTVSKSVNF